MIRRPPRSTQSRSSAASDVYKRQVITSEIVDQSAGLRKNRIERSPPLPRPVFSPPRKARLNSGIKQPRDRLETGVRADHQPQRAVIVGFYLQQPRGRALQS